MTTLSQIKVLILTACLTILSACSPNSGENESQKATNNFSEITRLEAKSGAFTGVNDFGIFPADSTSSKLSTLTLKNNGTEPLVGPLTLEDSPAFTLVYSNCPSTLTINKSCSIKVSFSPKSIPSGTYTSNLTFDTTQIALVAIKDAPVAPTGPAVQYSVSSIIVSAVSFGNITENQSVLKTISVKNISASSINMATSLTGPYSLVFDSCSNKVIPKMSTCSIKISLSGAGKEGDVLGNFSYAGVDLPLSGNVTSIGSGGGPAGSPNLVFSQDNNTVSGTVSQGSLFPSEAKQITLVLKNSGSLATVVSTATSSNSMFNIILNQCSNKSLGINGTCLLRIVVSGQNTTSYGMQSTDITFAGATVKLSVEILDPAGVISYEPVYSEYDACSAINACDGVGTKYRSILSCTKKQGNTVIGQDPSSACSAEFGTNDNLMATCNSPSGNLVSDIFDLGIQAGTLTVTCADGGTLPGDSRVAMCNSGFEQEGEQCIKLNNLQITKSDMNSGTIEVSGLDNPVTCDLLCSSINMDVRRDKVLSVNFIPNESNKYSFDNFSGDSGNCSATQCSSMDLSSNKALSINTHERKLLVLQETAEYTLNASGTGLFETVAPPTGAGFTSAKAYYVEENTNVSISASLVGGTNVITGWYINDIKQSAPVLTSVSNSIFSDTEIHASSGPNLQTCGNTAGDYFGVAAGMGKQAWNATTGEYAARCIPNNSSSCISEVFDDHGSENNYIYRTASLFPTGDTQDPDPAYPYAQGACVKNSLYCGESIAHSANAFRYSYGGENQYQSCDFGCEGGYKPSGSVCVPKKIYFSAGGTSTSNVYNIQAYNFETNTVAPVSSVNSFSGANFAPTLYDVADSGNVYLTARGVVYKNSTPIANLDNAQTDPSTMVAMEGVNKLFFNYNDFAQGMETFYTSTNNTTPVNPTVISYVAGATLGQTNNAQLINNGGWIYIMGLNNGTHGLEWGRLNPNSNGIDAINTVAGGSNGLDNSMLTIGNKPWLIDDYYFYYVGTNGSSGNEVMRISYLNPTSPGTILFAEVAPGATASNPGLLTKWNSNIWFKATNGATTDLYYKAAGSAGTAATKLTGFSATASSNITDMVVFKNKLYVAANVNATYGAELYEITDNGSGSYSATLVADIYPGTSGSGPQRMVENGESLYFMASDANGLSLMRYNGTTVTNLSVTLGVQPANPQFNGGKHKMMVK